jgi:peptide/nickel transport system substrate-binding protein
MKKKKIKQVLGLLIVFLFVMVPFVGQAEQKGQVVYANIYSIFYNKGGDPITHVAGQGPMLSTTVFEGLVDYGEDLSLLPSVAKSWKIAPDWSHIDIDIKEGIKFHNGDSLTAEDVKFSFEMIMNKKYRHVLANDYIKQIKNVQVLSPYKVRFNLNKPAPDLWKRFWWSGPIMPKKYREKVGDEEFAKHPIGSGPFKWADYKQDQYFQVEALKEHHRKAPEIKSLKVVYVPEHATRLAMLQAGEVDIAELIGPQIPVVKNDPKLKYFEVKYVYGNTFNFLDLAFPNEPSPFKDIRVRKAVSLAIDRQTICKKVFFEGNEPWGEVLNPYNLGFDPSVKPDPYDPEKAKALLAEAGYPKGFATTFNTTPQEKFMAEPIQANLAEVGIKADIKIFEGGSWYDAHVGKKLRGLQIRNSWYDAEPHPGADIQNGFSSDYVWVYVNLPEVDKAIKDSMYATTDKEAADWGRKLSKLIRESYKRPPLWEHNASYGLSPKILVWGPQKGSYPGTRFEYMKIKP